APGRPNPLPVYYASETAEAIHTRSPLGNKRRKSSVTCAYLHNLTRQEAKTCTGDLRECCRCG
ncbi:Vacuolar protein sorting/targeting protein 10, partial [Dissostichus eleginoides]